MLCHELHTALADGDSQVALWQKGVLVDQGGWHPVGVGEHVSFQGAEKWRCMWTLTVGCFMPAGTASLGAASTHRKTPPAQLGISLGEVLPSPPAWLAGVLSPGRARLMPLVLCLALLQLPPLPSPAYSSVEPQADITALTDPLSSHSAPEIMPGWRQGSHTHAQGMPSTTQHTNTHTHQYHSALHSTLHMHGVHASLHTHHQHHTEHNT